MANHLKIDFEALAIDVHLTEGMQIAVLTIVSIFQWPTTCCGIFRISPQARTGA
jgi:hypothetical protein